MDRGRGFCSKHGRAVRVDPIKPTVKAPGSKLLELKLLDLNMTSRFQVCFQFQPCAATARQPARPRGSEVQHRGVHQERGEPQPVLRAR